MKLDLDKIKKWAALILSFSAVFAFVSFSIYKGTVKKEEIVEAPVVVITPEYSEESLQYTRVSNESWADCAWLCGVDKDAVKNVSFTTSRRDEGVISMWQFDGINCFLYEDGTVEVLVGKGVKILGVFSSAFKGLQNVESINGLGLVDISLVTDITGLFEDCSSLKSVDFKNMNTESVLMADKVFKNCSSMEDLDMGDMNFKSAVSMNEIFYGCSGMNVMVLPKTRDVESMNYAFYNVGGSSYADTIVKRTMSTEKCKSMKHMFEETDFYDYQVAQNLKTDSLIYADHMFANSSMEAIDLSKWNTENLKDISRMFFSNTKLKSVNMEGWEMKSIDDISYMFANCHSLEAVDLNWSNVGNIKTANGMFDTAISLLYTRLNCFDGIIISNANNMFNNCYNLETIYCKGFETDVSDDMFANCELIVGAVEYDENAIDGSMANLSGYFKTESEG